MPKLPHHSTFKDKHKGETGVIVVAGPSLNNVPLEALDDYISFAPNLIYKVFTPNYYVNIGASHFKVASLNEEIVEMLENPKVIAGFINRLGIHEIPHTKAYSLASAGGYGSKDWGEIFGFSFAPLVTVGVRTTVVYVILQIAYYMGFQKMCLVGMDHDYSGPMQHCYPEDERQLVEPGEQYDFSTEEWLKQAELILDFTKGIYEVDGREIVNWTPESKLEVFRRETPPWLV